MQTLTFEYRFTFRVLILGGGNVVLGVTSSQPESNCMLSTLLLLSSFCLFIYSRFRKNRRFPCPPGPKGWPLIGNAFDFPTSSPWEVYCSWAKRYNSDILYGNVLGTHILILNNRADAEELLEKRSRNYSGRPYLPIVDLMGWNYNVGLMDYGPQWRYHRKICQKTFREEAAVYYYPTQARKVHEILGNLLLAPEKFEAHCKMLSVAIPMATMYGYDVKSFEDEFIEVAEKGQHLGNCLLVPGATLLNVVPILCRLPPIAGAARLAVYVRQLTEDMQRLPMEFAKNAMAAGVAKPSLVTSFLEKKAAGPTRELDEEEQAISKIAATVYSAAADTTIAAAMSFFFAMVTHPHVQKKAQQELDATIGTGRLPEYPDRESLPYLEAIYRELLRWRPPGPLGVPHCTSEDDIHKGYFIPKGTTVFSNIWAMTHDEAVYAEPSEFRPERHFTADGKLNKDDRILAYGFGRRVCVGRHVASSTLWLMVASVLATFDIVKAKDDLGSEIEVNSEYTDGLISQKKSFKCLFVPRSNQAIHLIQETTRTH